MNLSLEVPTIHLNGTSKERLLEAIEEAHLKIDHAIKALTECAPNGRDYYVGLKAGATYDRLEKALAEHSVRIAALLTVQRELGTLAEAIWEQGRKS